jgi:Domain of unknown function (DUF6748)
MASRVGLLGMLALVAFVAVGAVRGEPASGTAIYAVRVDPRLCPSPRCGGYWVALANGARTRCLDGLRRPRCYVARAVSSMGKPVAVIAEGALVRGKISAGPDDLGELVVSAVYAPTGTALVSGGYYRIVDTGIVCVRAPCFSYRATQVNGSTRTSISSVDLASSGAAAAQVARARSALRTKNGLYARGRFARADDGGIVFRALRLYLRAPLPRA